MGTLKQRWDHLFTPETYEEREAAELAQAEEEYAQEVRGIQEMVKSKGFDSLEKWIIQRLDEGEVTAGDHGHMLTAVGRREGLREVQDHLRSLRARAEEV